MSTHVDLVEAINQNLIGRYYGKNYRGNVKLDFSNVTWNQSAYMKNVSIDNKRVSESWESGLNGGVVNEYFKADTNMVHSWLMNEKSYASEVELTIHHANRLHRASDDEEGFPDTINFPHIGQKNIVENFNTPIPSGRKKADFKVSVIQAELKVRTYFSGEVMLHNGSYGIERMDINQLLEQAVDSIKENNKNQPYFLSEGSIAIQVRKLL